MAKTWKDISFERMTSEQRFETANNNASKGKRKQISCRKYRDNPERVAKLRQEVVDGTYEPLITKDKIIWDQTSQKHRTIRRPAYRDQIVHHLIMLELQPHIMKYLIQHNIACIPGRGSDYGRQLIKSWARKPKKTTRWVVQGDVKQYYENADGKILMAFFRKKIRDRRVLHMLQQVVDTFTHGFVLGYYICQWFGALYIAVMDHMIKHELGVKNYVRYVDNIVLAVDSKRRAYAVLGKIQEYLGTLGLSLKTEGRECCRIFRWADEPIDFIGYRTYRGGVQTLRARNMLSLRRMIAKVDKHGCSLSQARSLVSRRGLVKRIDCSRLRGDLEVMVKKYNVRRIISYADKYKTGRLAG